MAARFSNLPAGALPSRPSSPGQAAWVPLFLVGLLTGPVMGVIAEDRIDSSPSTSGSQRDFFETQVRPILVEHCFECHSHEGQIKGGLALDSPSGISQGGESGPAILPGDPDSSRLIRAVRYLDPDLQMPPKEKLAENQVAVLEKWVQNGAALPDSQVVASATPAMDPRAEWESLYQKRLGWWSLQPLGHPDPPTVNGSSWARNEIDRFILASLEESVLTPVAESDRRTLARRLSFALTGLPPSPEEVERFVAQEADTAYDDLVQSLLDSPHFGEHWARHWMDVVHYTDTHGYEWDVPTKNSWMYRDYLVRAFNDDLSFRQLVLEQIAGDLIEPRIDPESGLVDSLIGPTAMRLGERRHGDNGDAEGISQEMIANIIDTLTKGFLATTVACAQCHDHKLDAVEQRDYYGLAGMLMSTRWIARSAESRDPNLDTIEELKAIKRDIREELAKVWRGSENPVRNRILASPAAEESLPEDPKAKKKSQPKVSKEPDFPNSVQAFWRHLLASATTEATLAATWEDLAENFRAKRLQRTEENRANLLLVADFTREGLPQGWQVDGFGMKHGWVEDGEIVVADEGDRIVAQILPAGRWSHVWSPRLAGAVRSPLFAQDPPPTISVGYAGGHFAAQSLIVDHALHSERMKFPKQVFPGWLTLTTGNLTALAGGPDTTPRRVYLELATKSLNNYFPPRHAFGGSTPEDERDERSWLGITRVYSHPEGKPPLDEMTRYDPLFAKASVPKTTGEAAERLTRLVMDAIDRWSARNCDSQDVQLIDEALAADWLANSTSTNSALTQLVERYRETEKRLQPERVIGSVADWNEGGDARIGVRGSYTNLGEEVPRGNIRFLGGPGARAYERSSGRLEWARSIASDDNPLTARVFVNRVWHYLFGEGLVRTVDDFGHLGEQPSHPELLDWLARRFIEDGWSLKKLVRLMVTSAAWRQSSIPGEGALTADPENRLWHHIPMRRLEAEAIRDAILATAGRLETSLYGPPIDPYRTAEDPIKRLLCGPVDGDGRRSLYLKMTLMEPPKFLATFNQPIPKLTAGRRDATSVPDQALALLNDPFALEMAKHWSERVLADGARSPDQRVLRMFAQAFSRPPKPRETIRLVRLAEESARIRGADPQSLMNCQPVWQDIAHALFNLKEFIYVQ